LALVTLLAAMHSSFSLIILWTIVSPAGGFVAAFFLAGSEAEELETPWPMKPRETDAELPPAAPSLVLDAELPAAPSTVLDAEMPPVAPSLVEVDLTPWPKKPREADPVLPPAAPSLVDFKLTPLPMKPREADPEMPPAAPSRVTDAELPAAPSLVEVVLTPVPMKPREADAEIPPAAPSFTEVVLGLGLLESLLFATLKVLFFLCSSHFL